jgi:hypothetical protein
MLQEFARCYSLKTGASFNVKCRQIRYVQRPSAIRAKLVCTDALHISSTWPLKQSYLPAASPSIIPGILKTTHSLMMQTWVIGMRLASSKLSALRYVSLLALTLLSLCAEQARSSLQCKQLFKTIQERIKIRPCQLLLDMKVCWSSTYIMLTRAESRRQVSGLYYVNHVLLNYLHCLTGS